MLSCTSAKGKKYYYKDYIERVHEHNVTALEYELYYIYASHRYHQGWQQGS